MNGKRFKRFIRQQFTFDTFTNDSEKRNKKQEKKRRNGSISHKIYCLIRYKNGRNLIKDTINLMHWSGRTEKRFQQ